MMMKAIVNRKMNVLSKIVIPKTNITSTYISSEMEEFEREEFFRLKKILEIKRKMYEAHNKKEDKIMCNTCEPAEEWDVIKRCIECDALILPEEENTEEKEKLEQYKTHLDEIVNITKDMEEQGLIAASIEEFIKTAEGLKEKLEEKSESTESVESEEESYDPRVEELCEECKTKYLEEKAAAKAAAQEPEVTPVSEPQSLMSPKESKAKPVTPQPVATETVDLELGTFETEIQEITKIIRVKKEDGSVTEEKKVTRVKREVRAPIKVKTIPPPNPIGQERAGRITYQPSGTSGTSGTSSKSNPYSGSRTVGVVTTKSLDYKTFCPKYDAIPRTIRSELFSPPSPMSDPVARFCMSSVTLLSVDFGEYSPSLEESYIDYDEFEFNKT